MPSVRKSTRSMRVSRTLNSLKNVTTTSNTPEGDEKTAKLDRLDEEASASVFCPPPLSEACIRSRTFDDGVVRLLVHFARRHADDCRHSTSYDKKPITKEGFSNQERNKTELEYQRTFLDYLEHSAIERLSDELEQASLSDSEFSNATDLSIGTTKEANFVNTISVKALDHSIETRVTNYQKLSQQILTPIKVFKPTSPLPPNKGVLPNRLLNRATAVATSTNLPRESARYANLPFGLVLENFEANLMLTPKIPPDALREADAIMGADIRFDLPHPLSDLRGLNVLKYIMRYCIIQFRLSALLREQYQVVQAWQKSVPIELLREHVDKALLQMLPAKEREEFLEYFEFESGFTMNEEVYVKAIALSIRLYGHYLKNFHSSVWMYHASLLERIDFRHLSRRLAGIKLNPRLSKLLQHLSRIAADQFQP